MTKTLGEAGETFQSEVVSIWRRGAFRGDEALATVGWFETRYRWEPAGGRSRVNSTLPAVGDWVATGLKLPDAVSHASSPAPSSRAFTEIGAKVELVNK